MTLFLISVITTRLVVVKLNYTFTYTNTIPFPTSINLFKWLCLPILITHSSTIVITSLLNPIITLFTTTTHWHSSHPSHSLIKPILHYTLIPSYSLILKRSPTTQYLLLLLLLKRTNITIINLLSTNRFGYFILYFLYYRWHLFGVLLFNI